MLSRIEELIRKIKYYDYYWYEKGIRIISDQQVEALRTELLELEQKYQYTRPDSPSINIGYLNDSQRTIDHNIPMLSLNKTYDLEQIKKFFYQHKDYGIIAQPKLDGTAVSVIFINNILDSIILRGNGFKGNDISHHINIISNIPHEINLNNNPYPQIIVRGEIVAKNTKSRNIISGLLNRKHNNQNPYQLKFIAYDLIEPFTSTTTPRINNIESVETVTIDKVDDIEITINYFRKNFNNIDGIVFKIHDRKHFISQGHTARFPKGALAFKFSSPGKETTIIDITWSIGRKHQLIPTGHIEPIQIDNAIIKKVHLHNYSFLLEKQLGIGAIIKVNRTGNVVPTIVTIIKTAQPPINIKCPFCKSDTEIKTTHIICQNTLCSRVQQEKIVFFFRTLGTQFINQSYIYEYQQSLYNFLFELLNTNFTEVNMIKMQNSFIELKMKLKLQTIYKALEIKNNQNPIAQQQDIIDLLYQGRYIT